MTRTTSITVAFFRLGTVALIAGLVLVLITEQTWSRTETDMSAENKATILRSFEAWAAGTGGPYDLLAEDAEWTITGHSAAARTYPSREAFLSEVIRPFNARMREPLKPSVREIYADGDVVIVLFDAGGVARDGVPYVNTYSWYLHVRDGQIIRATAFFDSIVFDTFWARVQPELLDAVH